MVDVCGCVCRKLKSLTNVWIETTTTERPVLTTSKLSKSARLGWYLKHLACPSVKKTACNVVWFAYRTVPDEEEEESKEKLAQLLRDN